MAGERQNMKRDMKTKYKIQAGIPIPPQSRKKSSKYPWLQLKIGDSFFVPNITSVKLGSMTSHAKKRYKINLTARTFPDGVRVWRIK